MIVTRTDNPPDFSGRYPRTGTNHDIATRWAQRKYPSGRGNSMSFDGGTIRSYATPIARRVLNTREETVILITSFGYSMTTKSKHLPPVRRAAKGTVFVVGDVMANTTEEHAVNLDAMLDDIKRMVKTGLRSRTYRDSHKEWVRRHVLEMLAYGAFVGLTTFPEPSMPFPILLDWFEEQPEYAAFGADLRKLCG